MIRKFTNGLRKRYLNAVTREYQIIHTAATMGRPLTADESHTVDVLRDTQADLERLAEADGYNLLAEGMALSASLEAV